MVRARPKNKLGILGGGQLSQMLVEAAVLLDLDPVVLVEAPGAPATRRTANFVVVIPRAKHQLREFLRPLGTLMFENEFVDCEELTTASENMSIQFIPNLSVVRQWQDKLQQKVLLADLNIPCAPYEVLPPGEITADHLRAVMQKFAGPCVLKVALYGYDGKGNIFLNSDADLERAAQFCTAAGGRNIAVYAEPKVKFKRELAMVACQSLKGEFKCYPLVISRQEQGICKWIEGPATQLGVEARLEKHARAYAESLAQRSGIQGVFALEMFELNSGELWVNELAPRVHNSGHYTQDVGCASQFENHCRAVMGMELAESNVTKPFVMLNLLGPEGLQTLPGDPLRPKEVPGLHVHWYSKSELRPLRKMGHVNATANDAAHLAEVRKQLEQFDEKWKQSCRDYGKQKTSEDT